MGEREQVQEPSLEVTRGPRDLLELAEELLREREDWNQACEELLQEKEHAKRALDEDSHQPAHQKERHVVPIGKWQPGSWTRTTPTGLASILHCREPAEHHLTLPLVLVKRPGA